jgi:hypothetical protein
MGVYKPQTPSFHKAISFIEEWDVSLLPEDCGLLCCFIATLIDCSPENSRTARPNRYALLKTRQILDNWEKGIDLRLPLAITEAQRSFFMEKMGKIVSGLDWKIFEAAHTAMTQRVVQ